MKALAYANVDCAVIDPKLLGADTKKFQEWKTSNRVCLMTLRRVIPEAFHRDLKNKV